MSTDQTERRGVEGVRALVANLGWYVREPVRPDYGVDLFVETAEASSGRPTGHLLALQVKSGNSYVGEDHTQIAIRPNHRQLDYWSGHVLPVVIAVFDPSSGDAFWQVVNAETVESTGEGWKVRVPRDQRLDEGSREVLEEIATGSGATSQEDDALDHLRSDLTWMEVLDSGGSVILEAQEWINKTSGRGDITLIADPADKEKAISRQFTVFPGVIPYAVALPALFPWADLTVDDELMDQAEEDRWADETGIWDGEDKRYIGHTESFADWRAAQGSEGELRPYGEEAGEVDLWRLRLELNDLGRGVLALEKHLRDS